MLLVQYRRCRTGTHEIPEYMMLFADAPPAHRCYTGQLSGNRNKLCPSLLILRVPPFTCSTDNNVDSKSLSTSKMLNKCTAHPAPAWPADFLLFQEPTPPHDQRNDLIFLSLCWIYFPELLKIFVFNKRPENLASPKPRYVRRTSYILSTQISQRIVQRLFTCQCIKHCRGKVRVIPQRRSQFVQCIQCSRCRPHHCRNCRFHKSCGGNLCIVNRLCRSRCCWRSGECRTRQAVLLVPAHC
ncbi:Uncharacterised protein [Escherichia coli]|uniref:Uncharacterized protein n=1 Tax=Escherichia coli TaxID=562 RepID=A0A376TUJ4_ECOLX|nr:Uncharacterised protein [Escherichia coli]